MVFGVETIARENLERALADYNEKIPRVQSQLYDFIILKAFSLLATTQKATLLTEAAVVKKEADVNTLTDYQIKLDMLAGLQSKIVRLNAKKVAVEAELARRDVEGEPSTVHHTTYYIDYDNGNDGNDGLAPDSAHAWKTIPQFTTNTVRSAGDICYVRRNQTHSYSSSIAFDEDGAHNNPITLMGDDGTGWSGDQDIRPIIDFGANSAYFNVDGDYYWTFKNLDIMNGTHSYGVFRVGGLESKFYNCRFRDCDGGAYGVVFLYNGRLSYFKNCAWEGNLNNSLKFYQYEDAVLEDCTFDGNATCISLTNNCYLKLTNVAFGLTTTNSGSNLAIGSSVRVTVIGKNVRSNDTTFVNMTSTAFESRVLIEDYGGTKLDNRAWYGEGTIVRNTSVVRSGGADSSAECAPAANCSTFHPLSLIDIPIWAPASQKTYTIYLRGNGWSTFPTAGELWIEAYYYDGATAKRATVKSTQTLSVNDTWTAFSVTVTPNSAGPLYLRAFLAKYESGAKVYVDIKPVVS